MIDYSHTPIWLRCTDRWKIDPSLKGSIYGGQRSWEEAGAKLRPEDVKAIRESAQTIDVLAKTYDVALSTIQGIRSGRTYKDVR